MRLQQNLPARVVNGSYIKFLEFFKTCHHKTTGNDAKESSRREDDLLSKHGFEERKNKEIKEVNN